MQDRSRAQLSAPELRAALSRDAQRCPRSARPAPATAAAPPQTARAPQRIRPRSARPDLDSISLRQPSCPNLPSSRTRRRPQIRRSLQTPRAAARLTPRFYRVLQPCAVRKSIQLDSAQVATLPKDLVLQAIEERAHRGLVRVRCARGWVSTETSQMDPPPSAGEGGGQRKRVPKPISSRLLELLDENMVAKLLSTDGDGRGESGDCKDTAAVSVQLLRTRSAEERARRLKAEQKIAAEQLRLQRIGAELRETMELITCASAAREPAAEQAWGPSMGRSQVQQLETNWDQLPLEVAEAVLLAAGVPAVGSMACVSRKWRAAAHQDRLWHRLYCDWVSAQENVPFVTPAAGTSTSGWRGHLQCQSGLFARWNATARRRRWQGGGTSMQIAVVARFRPNSSDKVEGAGTAMEQQSKRFQEGKDAQRILNAQTGLTLRGDTMVTVGKARSYTFARVLDPETPQFEVFSEVKPLCDDVLFGYSSTFLAYGQTGSGKTHSIFGEATGVQRGVVPRACEYLLEAPVPPGTTVTLTASYVQVYSADVFDLLNENERVSMTGFHGDLNGRAQARPIRTTDDVVHLLAQGGARKAVAATLMNTSSSRSHSVFSIYISQRQHNRSTANRMMKSTLHLVDLAGSERVNKSEVEGKRFTEAVEINMSLSALERCIVTLTDPSFNKKTHVPYRDSPLTMLLKSSLGGSSRTAMLVTCASDAKHIDETLSTLRFGVRAARVTNGVSREGQESVQERMRELQQQIENIHESLKALNERIQEGGITERLAQQRVRLLSRAQHLSSEFEILRGEPRVDAA